MTAKARKLSFLFIFSLLAACSGSETSGGGAGRGTGGSAGTAGGGGSGGAPICAVAGAPCATGTECCSNVCDENGACTDPAGQCEVAGTACVSGADCCSGLCVEDGDGGHVCGNGFGKCQALGQSCGSSTDCCSLGCDGSVCVEEICKTDGQECDADSDCCSNMCGAQGTCVVPAGCLPAGEACGSGVGSTCCSGNCLDFGDGDMRCGTSGACRVVGEMCTAAEDCCSFNCVVAEGETFGQCDTMPGFSECKSVGEPCEQDTTCCSFTCRDDGTGFKSCQYLNGCRPMGELCREDPDCCNAAVQPEPDGVCAKSVNEDVGRCQNPGGDAPAGEVCATAGGGASGSNQCEGASGQGVGNENCRETSVGTYRCFAEVTQCFDSGESCALGDQCCSGICAPDLEGNLVCDPETMCPETDPICTMCVEDGEACTMNTDCCSGSCNALTMTCRACRGTGMTCTANSDCCANFCDPQTLTCQIVVQ
jgi:hypothetical protein